MLRFPSRGFGPATDALSDDAPDDPYYRWGAGVVSAILPVICGAMVIFSRHGCFLSARPVRIVEYHGNDAIALGISCIAIGLFMHAHYFWTVSRFYFMSEILKPVSLLMFAGGMGYIVVSQVLFL